MALLSVNIRPFRSDVECVYPDSAFIPYLATTYFEQSQEIAEVIQEYNQGVSIEWRVENIIKNIKTRATEDFLTSMQSSISSADALASYNLSHVEELKKVCLYIFNHKQSFSGREDRISFIATCALITINKFAPINTLCPITQDEVDEKDLLVTLSGQRFSLSALVEYHNTRDYKGTNGELFGNKFLLNPLVNTFFGWQDVSSIITQAISSNHEMVDLHCFSLLPPGTPNKESIERFSSFKSLREYYTRMRSFLKKG